MITCPSCNHQNPEGSLQCENCYTPLPATSSCPNCGASVQTDATFCGQCGFNLQAESLSTPLEETALGTLPEMPLEEVPFPEEISLSAGSPNIMPETSVSSPIQSPWDEQEEETLSQTSGLPSGFPEVEPTETASYTSDASETEFAEAIPSIDEEVMPFAGAADLESATIESELAGSESSQTYEELETYEELQSYEETEPIFEQPKAEPIESEPIEEVRAATPEITTPEKAPEKAPIATPEVGLASTGIVASATQLQVQRASLLHLQSNTTIEIPDDLDVVHFGKPNGQIPPDVDVSGFPDSEVVSRVHADIRIEGDVFYVEDTGSSNGTYVNHAPLQKGNRHRLRTGDRIALGKGDLVTFIFRLN